MASVFDVAGYILENRDETTAWQLQKFCYYSKAWYLALNNEELFPEHFGAWRNGPVCRPLYKKHEGMRYISKKTFAYNDRRMSDDERAIVKAVLLMYGRMTGDELSERTHQELPWLEARKGIPEGQNSNRNVKESIMRSFYMSQEDDYKQMEDNMLLCLANEREMHDNGKTSLKDVMKMFQIKDEDVM